MTNEKRSKTLSKDLMYERTFRLSSRTPHSFTAYYELIPINFSTFQLKQTKQTIFKKEN